MGDTLCPFVAAEIEPLNRPSDRRNPVGRWDREGGKSVQGGRQGTLDAKTRNGSSYPDERAKRRSGKRRGVS